MKTLLLTFFAGLACCLSSVATADAPVKHTSFKPGEIWTDNNGVHINKIRQIFKIRFNH